MSTTTMPAWASSTIEPEDGSHSGSVTVGTVRLGLEKAFHPDSKPHPVTVWLPDVDYLTGAQACRDLAAALVEAARTIEAATLDD